MTLDQLIQLIIATCEVVALFHELGKDSDTKKK